MSEYKEIKGGKVKNYTTNPDNPYVGQVWFNETEGELRVRKATSTSAWATGGNLNTAREHISAAGTQTAALGYGGGVGTPGAPAVANTESYNGSSWTELNDLNTARRIIALTNGTNTSALCYGGWDDSSNTDANESWNGTSWTELNDLNTARRNLSCAGADNTSSLAFGGKTTTPVANTESWNGS